MAAFFTAALEVPVRVPFVAHEAQTLSKAREEAFITNSGLPICLVSHYISNAFCVPTKVTAIDTVLSVTRSSSVLGVVT